MGNDDKSFPDDDEFRGDTASRKMRKLEDMGVLDKPKPHGDTAAFGTTSTVKTYPFEKTKKGGSRLGRVFAWFKKN